MGLKMKKSEKLEIRLNKVLETPKWVVYITSTCGRGYYIQDVATGNFDNFLGNYENAENYIANLESGE